MADLTEEILIKLANQDATTLQGLRALLNENMVFRTFGRTLRVLIHAKGDNYLRAVEAGLQSTINDVKHLAAAPTPTLDRGQCALFLYTLQNLITNLGNWQFANGKPNHYVPALTKKYHALLSKGLELGIDAALVRRECYSTRFRDPRVPALANFEFLDEERLDNVFRRLQKFNTTTKPADFFARHPAEPVTTPAVPATTILLDKLIAVLKQDCGRAELDLVYIMEHMETFFTVVGQRLGTRDSHQISQITDAIIHRLADIERRRRLGTTVPDGREQ